MCWIEELSALEQCDEYPEQPIGHASERATVTVAACAQRGVVRAAGGIALRSYARPVIRRLAQAPTAGIAHRDGAAAAALFRYRRHAHAGAQHVIRSIDQRLRGLSEHPGGDARPDPWHGADNGDVRMLALVLCRRCLAVERIQQTGQVPL